jgi:hypothetical protein
MRGSFGSDRTPKICRSPRLGRKTCSPMNETRKSVAIAAMGIHAGQVGALRGGRSRGKVRSAGGAHDSFTRDSRIRGQSSGLSQVFFRDPAAEEISSNARSRSAQREHDFA